MHLGVSADCCHILVEFLTFNFNSWLHAQMPCESSRNDLFWTTPLTKNSWTEMLVIKFHNTVCLNTTENLFTNDRNTYEQKLDSGAPKYHTDSNPLAPHSYYSIFWLFNCVTMCTVLGTYKRIKYYGSLEDLTSII